jgi:2,3-bisphosphoglycerate-dependent phosphoglycerate mutase
MIKEKYCTIYIVRHGETEHNVKEIMQGQTDSSLTKTGVNQAEKLAKEFKNIHFNAIFSSDLYRAKRTAEIVKLDRQLAVNTTELLRERAFGHFDGKTIESFQRQNKHLFKVRQNLSEKEKRDFKFYEEYESDSEMTARIITALREIAATYIGKTVLVVSHGSIIRAFLIHLGFAKFDELPPKSIENTAFAVLQTDGIDFFIKETKGINKIVSEIEK